MKPIRMVIGFPVGGIVAAAHAVFSSPEELSVLIHDESAKWGKIIRTAGIKLD